MSVDPAVLMKLLQAKQVLGHLRNIPMIGARLEAIDEALQGGEGLTSQQVQRLDAWAKRWEQIHEDVRSVYGVVSVRNESPASLNMRAAERCLWRIFEGHDAEGWCIGRMLELYHEIHGRRPSGSIAPCGAFRFRGR